MKTVHKWQLRLEDEQMRPRGKIFKELDTDGLEKVVRSVKSIPDMEAADAFQAEQSWKGRVVERRRMARFWVWLLAPEKT